MSDGERTAAQYDAMAEDYAADNDENATNAYYERQKNGVYQLFIR
jgi:hypothetical protein